MGFTPPRFASCFARCSRFRERASLASGRCSAPRCGSCVRRFRTRSNCCRPARTLALLVWRQRRGWPGKGARKRRRSSNGYARPRRRASANGRASIKIQILTGALKHAENDGADKREGDVRGQNAQVADERTKGHSPLPSSRHYWPCSCSKVATRFSAKKSDSLSMRRTIVVKES